MLWAQLCQYVLARNFPVLLPIKNLKYQAGSLNMLIKVQLMDIYLVQK